MTKGQRIAAAWAGLDARGLTEQVRLLVKAGDGDSRAVWAAVCVDPVLAARVRGALSGLKAEFRGHRDEAMWLLWITRAQQHLTAPPKPVVREEPAEPEPAEQTLVIERVVEQHSERAFDQPFTHRVEQPAEQTAVIERVDRPRPAIPGVLFQEPLPNAG
ncbi:hypothetical protein [Actinosynnema sp. NPDC020468]|uniref:hypothetical protein n=1 Tax=Actinosynnema sp. NPDC020468 TaxID=3154488 RepID=UPI0033EE0641